jgi:hypothetical protein
MTRSARCSTRYAPRRKLSTNVDIAILVAFVVGLLLYGIGTSMLRSLRVHNGDRKGVTWPQLVDESLTSANSDLRLDLVERLGIIGQPWCDDILRQAVQQESDSKVREAILRALAKPTAPF